MSQFDPDTFLSVTVESELSTETTPIPDGEYTASVKDVSARQSGDFMLLDVTWSIDDAALAEHIGIKNPTVRQSCFLDMTAQGNLDIGKGKNVQLGRLREALGQNTPRPWAPGMMIGCVAVIRTQQRQHEGRTFVDVKGVRKVG